MKMCDCARGNQWNDYNWDEYLSMFPRLLVDPFQLKIVREHFEGTSGKPLMALG
jgi:hypothetical protein